jgi:hypothetical protein
MSLTAADRAAVTDLINMHGHLTDSGALDRMGELFAVDAVFDLSDFGLGVRTGLASMTEATRAVGDAHPVGHHVTNIVLTEAGPDEMTAVSKGIGIRADGTCGSVVYQDTITRGPDGWRIIHRTIRTRRVPLRP